MDIAVIGMAGRFPCSENVPAFWENLKFGRDCIFREENLSSTNAGVTKINAFGRMNNIYDFDAQKFNIGENEALSMEPQERLFLECVYEALHNCPNLDVEKSIAGIVCGEMENKYYQINKNFGEKKNLLAEHNETFNYSGGALAGRIAYKLNFKGPALKIDTACSTSLEAVLIACDMLTLGYADVMFAGGTNVDIEQNDYVLIDGMSSKNGMVCPFDKNSSGMVPANGVGVLVLKTLEKAVEDGDYIYSVIKGGFITNDGKNKIGYTAPSVEGEVRAIQGALKKSGLEPEQIDYIETHGTATVLGDAVELKGLKKVFETDSTHKIAIGSLKGNFGHMNMSAGIAGAIKACLMLNNQMLVPSINITEENEELADVKNIYVSKEKKEYGLEHIGVSSFGLGGMNCHVIFEHYKNQKSCPEYINPDFERREYISDAVRTFLDGKNLDSKLNQNYEVLNFEKDDAKEKLLKIFREEIDDNSFSENDRFDEFGIQSMTEIMISTRISESFNCFFSIKDFYNCNCIEDVLKYVLAEKCDFKEKNKIEEFEDIEDLFSQFEK